MTPWSVQKTIDAIRARPPSLRDVTQSDLLDVLDAAQRWCDSVITGADEVERRRKTKQTDEVADLREQMTISREMVISEIRERTKQVAELRGQVVALQRKVELLDKG